VNLVLADQVAHCAVGDNQLVGEHAAGAVRGRQKFLRDNQPKTVIFWGQHDPFFNAEGGEAFLKDLPKAELHRLNAGHFATEDNLPYIANHIISFYDANVKRAK